MNCRLGCPGCESTVTFYEFAGVWPAVGRHVDCPACGTGLGLTADQNRLPELRATPFPLWPLSQEERPFALVPALV